MAARPPARAFHDRQNRCRLAGAREERKGRRRQPLRHHGIIATTDVDDDEQALSATYLRCGCDRNRAGLDTRLNAIAIERTTVGYLRFGADIRILADEPTSYHVNVAPAGGPIQSRRRERGPHRAGHGLSLHAREAGRGHLDQRNEQMCLMFDPADVEHELTRLLGRELTDPLTRAPSRPPPASGRPDARSSCSTAARNACGRPASSPPPLPSAPRAGKTDSAT
jgi:hypothetical protein